MTFVAERARKDRWERVPPSLSGKGRIVDMLTV
jgi:hypothetical protein